MSFCDLVVIGELGRHGGRVKVVCSERHSRGATQAEEASLTRLKLRDNPLMQTFKDSVSGAEHTRLVLHMLTLSSGVRVEGAV
ncbi:hypothetical protein E2C01_044496 [Portunus trituberculatus]|uniref:Uncharacterized protein n=1 Tax=Portunus trituberculatus TaxID=210409 RepID=A0A5B7FZ66_PORTR|nr:hypothetical protein [Portunus trituberculatus]